MSGMDLLVLAAERSGAMDPAGPPSSSRPPLARSDSKGSRGSHASLPPKKRLKLARFDCGTSVVSAESSGAFSQGRRGGGRAEAPAANSEWMCDFVDGLPTFAAPRPEQVVFVPNRSAKPPVWISPEKWRDILPTVTSNTVSNEANGKAKEGKAKGRGRRKRAAPLVRDVDGNDIGMGYFSMNPPRNTVSPVSVPPSPAAEGPTAPASPPPFNLQDADAEEPAVGTVAAEMEPPASGAAKLENQGEDNAASTAKKMLYQAYLSALNQPAKGQ